MHGIPHNASQTFIAIRIETLRTIDNFFDAVFRPVHDAANGVGIVFLPVGEAAREKVVAAVGDQADEPDLVVPGVGREENHATSGLEDAIHLTKCLLRAVEVFQHPGGDDEVKGIIGKRQRIGGANNGVAHNRIFRQRLRVRVNAIGMRRLAIDRGQKIAVTAADIENAGIRLHIAINDFTSWTPLME